MTGSRSTMPLMIILVLLFAAWASLVTAFLPVARRPIARIHFRRQTSSDLHMSSYWDAGPQPGLNTVNPQTPPRQLGYSTPYQSMFENGRGYMAPAMVDAPNTGGALVRRMDGTQQQGGPLMRRNADNFYNNAPSKTVHGGTLRTTQPSSSPYGGFQDIYLTTEGRPLESNVEVWRGPNNSPQTIKTYSDNGYHRPFRARVGARGLGTQSIAMYNSGPMAFPMQASVGSMYHLHNSGGVRRQEYNDFYGRSSSDPYGSGTMNPFPASSAATARTSTGGQTIQGGSSEYYPFNGSTNIVQVTLESDGNPIMCEIEVLQGPNTVKQNVQVYLESGETQPFVTELELPGYSNVVRILNRAPMAYPLRAKVEPFGGGGW